MDLRTPDPPLLVCVGSGGVGKTTLAAALGLVSARAGHRTLVMTFDPSLRLKDALGVGDAATDQEIEVPIDAPATLHASLLDPRRTFDRLVETYTPDAAARDRILGNRYYDQLAGHLGGLLEYMAVERLYEVAGAGAYDRIILDTPPTRQAIDFLEAPGRITGFLDSGALRIALKSWFDEDGSLRPTSRLSFVGRGLERFLDNIVGLQLLRDMSEFFRAFAPMFDGFRQRAFEVEAMLAAPETRYMLVTGPGEARVPDTLFFARRLQEAGWHLGPIVVNRVHPPLTAGVTPTGDDPLAEGRSLFGWLGERHARGLTALRGLVSADQVIASLPLEPDEPTDLASLEALGNDLQHRLVYD